MRPPIFAILAMFSLTMPVLAQPQPRPQQQNGVATVQPAVQPDLDPRGSPAGAHANQTGGGNAENPAPHIYKRGEHISPSYGAFDVVADWRRAALMRPPEGSHWVKYGENYLLVTDQSGLITDIVKGA